MIEYREYRPQDADDVKAIVGDAFSAGSYTSQPELLNKALDLILGESLAESTYSQVAVKDGRVLGVLKGRLKGKERIAGSIGDRLRSIARTLSLLVKGPGDRTSLLQYLRLPRAYARLRKMVPTPLPDEITFFAVDESTRGTGVGKELFNNFMRYLQDNGRTTFFLFTDDTCSYEFYDRKGMKRVATTTVEMDLENRPKTIEVYLYAGRVRTS